MVPKNLSLLFSLVISLNSFGVSAVREEGVSYLNYINEYVTAESMMNSRVRVSYESLDISQVPEIKNLKEAMTIFSFVRDERFLKKKSSFPRRLSWLYPNDGCFARAEYAIRLAEKFGKKFKKLFIYGDLKVKTIFSPNGYVTWWYHVAPIFKHKEVVYVIDPALNAYGPLSLNDWALKQVPLLKKASFSICTSQTYSPRYRCSSRFRVASSILKKDQNKYLSKEKRNLRRLGYEFKKELGDNPYWKR